MIPICSVTHNTLTEDSPVVLMPLKRAQGRSQAQRSGWMPAGCGIRARYIGRRANVTRVVEGFELTDSNSNRILLADLFWHVEEDARPGTLDFPNVMAQRAPRLRQHLLTAYEPTPDTAPTWAEFEACWEHLFPQDQAQEFRVGQLGLAVMHEAAWRELAAMRLGGDSSVLLRTKLRTAFDEAKDLLDADLVADQQHIQRCVQTGQPPLRSVEKSSLDFVERLGQHAEWAPPLLRAKEITRLVRDYRCGKLSAERFFDWVRPWMESAHALEGLRLLNFTLAPMSFEAQERRVSDRYQELLARVTVAS